MNIQKKNGYSIVEILVYLAIFTTMSIMVINYFIVVLGSFHTTRANRDLLESGATSIERIAREVRQADSVDIVNSTLSSSPGALQLNSTDSSGNPMIIKFSVTNGALNLYEDGSLIGNLLSENISVTTLVFRRIVTANGEAVKIELTLQSTDSDNSQSENFYNTIILRGGY